MDSYKTQEPFPMDLFLDSQSLVFLSQVPVGSLLTHNHWSVPAGSPWTNNHWSVPAGSPWTHNRWSFPAGSAHSQSRAFCQWISTRNHNSQPFLMVSYLKSKAVVFIQWTPHSLTIIWFFIQELAVTRPTVRSQSMFLVPPDSYLDSKPHAFFQWFPPLTQSH